MYDLTSFEHDLLIAVGGLTGPHGLTVKDELDEYYEKEFQHGRLYPDLDNLVEKGLIDKSKEDARTNEYQLTRYGCRELEARHAWENQFLKPDVVRDN